MEESGVGDMSELTNEEDLIAKHKKEKKDLQSKIMKLKKSVPKGDKRKLKEIKLEIAILENNLDEKHKIELEEFAKNEQKNLETTSVIEQATAEIKALSIEANGENANKLKVSKAKRKRDRKAAKQREKNNEIESESQKDYLTSQRYKEEEIMKAILAKQDLKVKHMKSDGNCMYYAVEDQLKAQNISHGITELRNLTADYMLNHADEFLPFLTKHDTGDCYTHNEYVHYCDDIKTTSAWGGQLELRALSQALQTPIHVIQAEAPLVVIGDEFNNKEIILTYHRHQFGLGEHYNSVTSINDQILE